MNYFWIRVFDYNHERDMYDKGTMLDEFYLRGKTLDRDFVKEEVKNRYNDVEIKFAKPRSKDGLYAIVMESSEYWYDYKYKFVDSYCFQCHKPIKGFAREFPKTVTNDKETFHFCCYTCKSRYYQNFRHEGEFQEKESISDRVIGYIYHMYNRVENKHYIGQTKYLPFFRWQEHIKDGCKGDITDITFEVITEVKKKSDEDGQELLNNVEAWWIRKYIEEGYEVYNVSIPRLTIQDYKDRFDKMILKKEE